MNVELLKQHLIRDEGVIEHVYFDHLGYATIGCGHMVDERLGGGLDDDVIEHQLKNDIERVEKDLQKFSWWQDLHPIRQVAIANMRFQLGPSRFRGFKKMIQALEEKNYHRASEEAKDSRWYQQTPERAERVIRLLLTGHE